MADSATPQKRVETPPRWVPAPPAAVVVPGVLLLWVGLLMVSDGEVATLGWSAIALGLPLMLVGAVAHGVAWGLDLHHFRRS